MSPPTFTSEAYTSPTDFLEKCAPALLATRPVSANIPLSAAYRRVQVPAEMGPADIWLAVTSSDGVLYTMTVTDAWPGSLACSHDPEDIPSENVTSAMAELGRLAHEKIVPGRLHAASGPRALVDPFVDLYVSAHDLKRKEKPTVHMYHSHVDKDILRDPTRTTADGYVTRRASETDLEQAWKLVFDFAAPSPYRVTEEAARARTKMMIDNKDLYVCERTKDGVLLAVSSLMRPTPGVKAISMVYTAPDARGQGLAELVVRAACQGAFDQDFDKVCLNVDPANAKAARVYGRVGFVGLETGVPGPGTEEWIDQGWDTI